MKREELESINNELFSALNLDDQQQYIIGQDTRREFITATSSPNPGQGDADYGISWDWS